MLIYMKLKKSLGVTTFLIFVLLVNSIFLPPVVYGENKNKEATARVAKKESVFIKSYNRILRFIDEHDYVLTPLYDAIAGWNVCGGWCGLAGGIAGAIDETLVHFGYTDRRYLTWGILGAANANKIHSGIVAGTAGAIVGVLLPTGIFNEYAEYVTPAIAPMIATSAGYTSGGVGGAFDGAIYGAADEVLISQGYADKHYLTASTLGMAATSLMGYFSPPVANFLGAALGMVAAHYYEEQIVENIQAPINTTKRLYNLYSKFIPKEQLDDHIEKQAIALLGSQFLVQFLSLKSTNYLQAVTENFERLNLPAKPDPWSGLKSHATKFAIFIFPKVIMETVLGEINGYFNTRLRDTLEYRIKSEIFSQENMLRLERSSVSPIDALRSDVPSLVSMGTPMVTSSINTAISGMYGTGVIVIHSPNLFLYTLLYNQALALISNYLNSQRAIYNKNANELWFAGNELIRQDTTPDHIKMIAEQGGFDVTKDRVLENIDSMRKFNADESTFEMLSGAFSSTVNLFNNVFNYLLMAREINQGRIPFDKRGEFNMAHSQVENLLSLPSKNAFFRLMVEQSLERIMVLEGVLHDTRNSKDQIERRTFPGNSLVLKDLAIGVENRTLAAVENLELELGKTYVITGNNGCGKSSLLTKIKGIKENGIWGRGEINYPEIDGHDPLIVMRSNGSYSPVGYSLYEFIMYPDKIPEDKQLIAQQKQNIANLLAELKFDGNWELDLDRKEDWGSKLSKGEMAKIGLISALIKQPDILILDEALDHLDHESLRTAQTMLKKYLKKSLLLVVDHKAYDNNYDGFYDEELYFAGGTIIKRNIAPRVN